MQCEGCQAKDCGVRGNCKDKKILQFKKDMYKNSRGKMNFIKADYT